MYCLDFCSSYYYCLRRYQAIIVVSRTKITKVKKRERCFTCCIISYQTNLHVTKYLNLLIQSFPNLEQCRMKTTWYLWQQYNLLTFNQLHIATTFYFLTQTPISALPVLLWYPIFCLLDFWTRLCDSIFIGLIL